VILAPFNKDVARFYEGALRRAQRTTAILAAVAFVAAMPSAGWRIAVSIGAGAIVGWLNFYWLITSCSAMLDRVHALNVQAGANRPKKAPGTSHAIALFVVRYLALAAIVCAIFMMRFFNGLYFFAAFSLPVSALMIEAVMELWVSLRKGL
jgi:hypothetical protein